MFYTSGLFIVSSYLFKSLWLTLISVHHPVTSQWVPQSFSGNHAWTTCYLSTSLRQRYRTFLFHWDLGLQNLLLPFCMWYNPIWNYSFYCRVMCPNPNMIYCILKFDTPLNNAAAILMGNTRKSFFFIICTPFLFLE